jgi:hypothetical protein
MAEDVIEKRYDGSDIAKVKGNENIASSIDCKKKERTPALVYGL